MPAYCRSLLLKTFPPDVATNAMSLLSQAVSDYDNGNLAAGDQSCQSFLNVLSALDVQLDVQCEASAVPNATQAPVANPQVGASLSGKLPSPADVPPGLVQTLDRTRSLEELARFYTNPGETIAKFTAWGWKGNGVLDFSSPNSALISAGEIT